MFFQSVYSSRVYYGIFLIENKRGNRDYNFFSKTLKNFGKHVLKVHEYMVSVANLVLLETIKTINIEQKKSKNV